MSASTTTASKSVKKVATKTAPAAAAPAVAAPAPVAVAAAPAKEKKVKAAAVVEAAPAVATNTVVAPEASAVAAAAEAAPAVSSASQIDALIAEVSSVRDAAAKTLKSLHVLKKNIAREVKEAGRRRRRNRKTSESSDGSVPKRPSIFTTPVGLKDELASFLGKAKGTKMTPAEVNKAIKAYVDSHKLKEEKGHVIHADAAMRKCLGLSETDVLTYKNIQTRLYKLYVLPEKKASTTA